MAIVMQLAATPRISPGSAHERDDSITDAQHRCFANHVFFYFTSAQGDFGRSLAILTHPVECQDDSCMPLPWRLFPFYLSARGLWQVHGSLDPSGEALHGLTDGEGVVGDHLADVAGGEGVVCGGHELDGAVQHIRSLVSLGCAPAAGSCVLSMLMRLSKCEQLPRCQAPA